MIIMYVSLSYQSWFTNGKWPRWFSLHWHKFTNITGKIFQSESCITSCFYCMINILMNPSDYQPGITINSYPDNCLYARGVSSIWAKKADSRMGFKADEWDFLRRCRLKFKFVYRCYLKHDTIVIDFQCNLFHIVLIWNVIVT